METGLLVAYVALLIGAVVPIYLGSFGSLKYPKDPKAAKVRALQGDMYTYDISASFHF
jgi:hypothetical protein